MVRRWLPELSPEDVIKKLSQHGARLAVHTQRARGMRFTKRLCADYINSGHLGRLFVSLRLQPHSTVEPLAAAPLYLDALK